jgi:hypothetical protein
MNRNSSPNEYHEQKEDCLPCKYGGAALGVGAGYLAVRKAMELQKSNTGNPNKAVALGVTGVCTY